MSTYRPKYQSRMTVAAALALPLAFAGCASNPTKDYSGDVSVGNRTLHVVYINHGPEKWRIARDGSSQLLIVEQDSVGRTIDERLYKVKCKKGQLHATNEKVRISGGVASMDAVYFSGTPTFDDRTVNQVLESIENKVLPREK